MKRLIRSSILPLLLTVLAVLAPPAWSGDPTPLTEILSFDEFRDLVKDSVGRIPDLQTLWQWKSDKGVKGLYFTGGAFRGLLLYLHQELQTKSPDEIKNQKMPNIDQLLIIKDADRDMVAPDNLVKGIKGWLPYQHWDILGEKFFTDMSRNGGATIDKVRAHPGFVQDYSDAFEKFYEGKLEFFLPDADEFLKSSKETIVGDTRLGLALRFLRFTADLSPAARPTPESLERIRQIPELEKNFIPQNHKLTNEYSDFNDGDWSGKARYRIKKALKKFWQAHKDKTIPSLVLLKDAGLLKFIAEKRYGPNYNWSNAATFVEPLHNAGFTAEELRYAAAICVWSIDSGIQFKKNALKFTKSFADLVWVLGFEVSPSDDYKKAVSKMVTSNEVIEKIMAFEPEIASLKKLEGQLVSGEIDHHIRFMQAVIDAKLIRSAADFIELTRYTYEIVSDPFKIEMEKFIVKNLDAFIALEPSIEQIKILEKRNITLIDNHTEFARRGLKFVHSQNDFKDLTGFVYSPNDALRKAMDRFKERYADLIGNMPSITDILKANAIRCEQNIM